MERGSKITENVQTSFLDGSHVKKVLLSKVYFRRTVERTYARIKCHELVNFLNIANNIFKCCENKILSHRKSRTGKFNGLNLKESFE